MMSDGYKTLGFVLIAIWYAVIGLMAAFGTIWINRKMLTAKREQTFYAIFLIVVAAFYLVFVAYFEVPTAWRTETIAVFVFVVLGVLGLRLPVALIIGYPLHGLWDLVHEIQAHGVWSAFEPSQLTAIPLAYGVFCAVYDFSMAFYFYRRRVEWSAARKGAH